MSLSDFASQGTELQGTTFTADENETYSVYVKDEAGNETIQTITIDNIDQKAPIITLTPSITDLTNKDIIVSVDVDGTVSEVKTIKLLKGKKNILDFENAGEVITDSFTVSNNGNYTVYAVDEVGNETVTTISIKNIITIKEKESDEQDAEADILTDKAGNVTVKINSQTFHVIMEEIMQEMITGSASIQIEGTTISLLVSAENFKNESLEIIAEKIEGIKNALSAYSFTILQESGEVSQFSSPVTLTFTIDEADMEGLDTDKLKVYYLNEETNVWELIGGSFEGDKVTVEVDHFSTYAVFSKDPNKTELPNTATSNYNYIIAGVLILLAGFIVVIARRRRA
ncbi:hypothetical protein CIB95_15900 [Lottiidibacillus patelloidae]|uniref:Gram-positive cocci surface proteins LPxTG domain-containing protein n=1 Tax=Lottiidibacillus patelloidae TaxID=2670334 RepID=A0A263BPN0_9BACI|nr:hypothetical protein CIB95_15900 [Lottiidibacillus patelloidae]